MKNMQHSYKSASLIVHSNASEWQQKVVSWQYTRSASMVYITTWKERPGDERAMTLFGGGTQHEAWRSAEEWGQEMTL